MISLQKFRLFTNAAIQSLLNMIMHTVFYVDYKRRKSCYQANMNKILHMKKQIINVFSNNNTLNIQLCTATVNKPDAIYVESTSRKHVRALFLLL